MNEKLNSLPKKTIIREKESLFHKKRELFSAWVELIRQLDS